MKKILLLLLVFALVFAGPTQTYVQKVDASGASSFEERREMATFLQLLPPGALKKIIDTCIVDSSLACSVNGTVITMGLQIPSDNSYYTFTKEYGFFTTTTLTINRVPTDRFDASINRILSKAGVSSGEGSATALDLNDKKGNSVKAAAFKEAGITINYSITMPGGTAQSFDLVALLEDSKPIVLAESELNYWLLSLIIGVIVLAAFAYSFFGGKKVKKTKKR